MEVGNNESSEEQCWYESSATTRPDRLPPPLAKAGWVISAGVIG